MTKPWSEMEARAKDMLASGGRGGVYDVVRAAVDEIDRLHGILVDVGQKHFRYDSAQAQWIEDTASHRVQFYGGERGGKAERQRRVMEAQAEHDRRVEQQRELPSEQQIETWIRENNIRAAQRAVNRANSAMCEALPHPSVKKPSPERDHPIDGGHLEGPTLTLQGAIGRGDQARRFRHISTMPIEREGQTPRWTAIIDVIGMKQEARESFSVSVAVTALGNVVVTFHALETPAFKTLGQTYSRGTSATWPVTTHVIREPLDVTRTPTAPEKGD